MIEQAVNTKVKAKIIKFLSSRDEEFQVSDIARALKISKSRSSETLRELSGIGILSSRQVGRSVLYKFSSGYIAKTLRRSMASETALLEGIENEVIKETKSLTPLSIVRFGSSLRGLKFNSDVDFLVVAKNTSKRDYIYEIVGNISAKFGIHISIMLMEYKDFIRKAKRGNEFALNAMAGKLVWGKNF